MLKDTTVTTTTSALLQNVEACLEIRCVMHLSLPCTFPHTKAIGTLEHFVPAGCVAPVAEGMSRYQKLMLEDDQRPTVARDTCTGCTGVIRSNACQPSSVDARKRAPPTGKKPATGGSPYRRASSSEFVGGMRSIKRSGCLE